LQEIENEGDDPDYDSSHKEGHEKVRSAPLTKWNQVPTHAARQLADGRWTRKMGKCEDIEHDTLDDVVCSAYGTPVATLDDIDKHLWSKREPMVHSGRRVRGRESSGVAPKILE
jgi:hypothetical protein